MNLTNHPKTNYGNLQLFTEVRNEPKSNPKLECLLRQTMLFGSRCFYGNRLYLPDVFSDTKRSGEPDVFSEPISKLISTIHRKAKPVFSQNHHDFFLPSRQGFCQPICVLAGALLLHFHQKRLYLPINQGFPFYIAFGTTIA